MKESEEAYHATNALRLAINNLDAQIRGMKQAIDERIEELDARKSNLDCLVTTRDAYLKAIEIINNHYKEQSCLNIL